MDESKIKRLLIIVAVSIVVIMVLKTILLKTAVKISNVATEKKQAVKPPASPPAAQQAPIPAVAAEPTPAVSTTSDTQPIDTPASGVSENP